MKINLVSYLDPFVYSGGGEAITRKLVEEGRIRGHLIKVTSVRPLKISFHLKPDIVLFCDLINWSSLPKGFRLYRFPVIFLKFLARSRKVFHLNNAYTDVCDLPYLPCNGNSAAICKHKQGRCFASSTYSKKIRRLTTHYLYLSPLHKSVSQNIIAERDVTYTFFESLILKPFIDTKLFYNRNNPTRTIKKLFVGVISEAKGISNYEKSEFAEEITYVGSIEKTAPKGGRYLGKVNYERIPEIMNDSQDFIFLPRWPEPQGRVVVEAALCGCNLICNSNVGATSFGLDLSNPKNIENEPAKTWEQIECLV